MTVVAAIITTEAMEHADGRPVAYVDATAVAIFAYQEPDGTYVIKIYTRDDIPSRRLSVLLDDRSLLRAPTSPPIRSEHPERPAPGPTKAPDSGRSGRRTPETRRIDPHA
jgi:hypothetical protein